MIVAPDAPDLQIRASPSARAGAERLDHLDGLAPGDGCDGGGTAFKACVRRSEIDGAVYMLGAPDPVNACRSCQPAIGREAGRLTNVACVGGVCKAGSVNRVHRQQALTPGGLDPATTALVATLRTPTSFSRSGGTTCSDGGVCLAGSCQQGCASEALSSRSAAPIHGTPA